MLLCQPAEDYCTLEDRYSRHLPADYKETASIPEISDIPITVVNKVLFK